MAANSTTAMDIITGALRNINALEAGETPSAADAADALMVLNDLIEAWSIDKLMIFSSVENILTFTPGQYQYTVGNPVNTSTPSATPSAARSPVPSSAAHPLSRA